MHADPARTACRRCLQGSVQARVSQNLSGCSHDGDLGDKRHLVLSMCHLLLIASTSRATEQPETTTTTKRSGCRHTNFFSQQLSRSDAAHPNLLSSKRRGRCCWEQAFDLISFVVRQRAASGAMHKATALFVSFVPVHETLQHLA